MYQDKIMIAKLQDYVKILNDVVYLFICTIPLLSRALGIKARHARYDRVSCIQYICISSNQMHFEERNDGARAK